MQPIHMAARLEQRRELERTYGDSFTGYGLLGIGFESGHVLAFRRFAASSIGPPFVSLWLRDPQQRWIFHTSVDPSRSCPRYYEALLHDMRADDIEIRWTGPAELCITARRARLQLALRFATTAACSALGMMARLLPRAVWSSPRVSSSIGALSASLLRARALSLSGVTPSGHAYALRPRALWRVVAAAAVLDGRDLGGVVPLDDGVAFGDFAIPRTGLLVAGSLVFTHAQQRLGRADVRTQTTRDALLARAIRSGSTSPG